MEVVVVDNVVYQGMVSMFKEVVELNHTLSKENKSLKLKALLTPKELADMTGYSERTIRGKRHDIGFVTIDNGIRFKPEDVEAWIESHRIMPRAKRRKTA